MLADFKLLDNIVNAINKREDKLFFLNSLFLFFL